VKGADTRARHRQRYTARLLSASWFGLDRGPAQMCGQRNTAVRRLRREPYFHFPTGQSRYRAGFRTGMRLQIIAARRARSTCVRSLDASPRLRGSEGLQ